MSRKRAYTWGFLKKEKKKDTENLFKQIMEENFPNLGREGGIQIHEAQRISYRLKPKRDTSRHVMTSF